MRNDKEAYIKKNFAEYVESGGVADTLRATGGDIGGGSETLIVTRRTYNQVSQSAAYKENDVAVSITVCGGSYGGGSEVLVLERRK